MPTDPKECLDRRDFVIASIGLLGTSATFATFCVSMAGQQPKAKS